MARGLKVKVGSFDVGTGTGNKVVTGVGFVPKALILYSVAAPTTGLQTSFWAAIGFVTATEAYCVATYSADAAADSNTSRRMAAKAISFVTASEAQGPEANLASLDSDGFTLNFTTNPWNNTLINYIALGGDDLSNAKVVWTSQSSGSTGLQSVTGVGFKPDCVLNISANQFTVPSSGTNASIHLGAMDKHGNQWANTSYSLDAQPSSDTARAQLTDACHVGTYVDNVIYQKFAFASMDSDGFTWDRIANQINWSIISLCLKGGSYKVGNITTLNGSGYQSVQGVGFEPRGLLTSNIGMPVLSAPSVHAAWTLGAASSASNAKLIGIGDVDNLATTNVDGYQGDYVAGTPWDGTLYQMGALASFDNNGFTVNWSGTANQNQTLYLAFGNTIVEDTVLDVGTTVKVGSFAGQSGSGLQQVTGVGFRPKALILYGGETSANGFAPYPDFHFGFATGGGKQYGAGYGSINGGTLNTFRGMTTSIIYALWDNGAIYVWLEGKLESFDADGFTINWPDPEAGNLITNYIAIGGSDLTDANVAKWDGAATSANSIVTGVGFKPDLVMHLGILPGAAAAFPYTQVHGNLTLGMMDKDGNQWSNSIASQDNVVTSNTSRWQRADSCIASVDFGEVQYRRATYFSMDSDGFTVSWPVGGAHTFVSLCLKGPSFKVGSFTTPSGVGSSAVAGVGFAPRGVLVSGFNWIAQSTPVSHASWTLGAASSTSERKIFAHRDRDAISPAQSESYQNSLLYVGIHDTSGATTQQSGDLTSFDTGGFTVGWTSGPGFAAQILYLAIGDAATTFIGWGIPIK